MLRQFQFDAIALFALLPMPVKSTELRYNSIWIVRCMA